MKLHTISLIGRRESNEDVVVIRNSKDKKEIVVCIFDGHGGKFVSDYLGQNLLRSLSNIHTIDGIQRAICNLQKQMVYKHPKETKDCGSTVLVCRLFIPSRTLQVIHLGDTRAVLRDIKHVRPLTVDHKPETPNEKLRIASTGENVEWDHEDEVYRVNGYSVSRAMGDADAPGISQLCDVAMYKWTSGTRYLILACDGLWDVLTSEQACQFVDKQYENMSKSDEGKKLVHVETSKNKANIAHALAQHALKEGSMDNISIVIIFF